MASVEKNIPLPQDRNSYPFREMLPGDSILLDADGKGNKSKPAMAARVYAKRSGRKFTLRSIDGGAQVRIWRVS